MQQSGLDFSSRAARGLDFSARAARREQEEEQPRAPQPRAYITARPRSLGERFVDSATDAINRNPTLSVLRGVLPRGGIEYQDPNTGEPIRYETLGDQVARQERERRDAYAQRSEGDPWYRAPGGTFGRGVAGLSTLGGVVTGSAGDPVNLVSPGRTVVGRAIGNAGVNAAGDVVAQGGDLTAGIEDRYSPEQTIVSGLAGGAISLTGDAAGAAGRQGLRFIRENLVNPLPDFSGRAMDATASVQPPRRARPAERPSLDNIITAEDYARQTGQAAPPDFSRRARRGGQVSAEVSGPVSREGTAGPRPASTVDDLWGSLLRQESGSRQADASGQLIRSPVGAFGAAQLMPETAREVAESLGDPRLADLARQTTPEGRRANELLGRTYLQWQLREFGSDVAALAAYNAGPGRVREWIERFGDPRVIGAEAWAARIPFDETRNYVASILGDRLSDGGASGGGFVPIGRTSDADRFGTVEPLASSERREQAPQERRESLPDPFAPSEGGAASVPPLSRSEGVSGPSLTDRALDLLRRGERVRLDQGPSLLDWLSRRGGLNDVDGELRNLDADRWHRDQPFRPRLVREGGSSLEDAAVAAQEMGFLPERFGADRDNRATPQDLIDAIADELSGRPRYARADEDGAALAQQMADLDELLTVLEIDPRQMSNRDITARIDAYFRDEPAPARRDEPSPFILAMREGQNRPTVSAEALNRLRQAREAEARTESVRLADGVAEQTLIPGVEPVSAATRDLADLEARRAQRRGDAPPPAGGLFDEAARAQPDLFASQQGKLLARGPDFSQRARSNGGPDFSARARDGDKLAVDLTAYGSRVGGGPAPKSGGRAPSGLRDAPRPGAVKRADGVRRRVARVADLARRLRAALGITHRQGRVMRGALGEFDTGSGVVRTRAVQELDVLAHEATHALEYRKDLPALQAALNAHAAELTKLAYPGAAPGVLRQEGFAEFGRWYLTNPNHARRVAPGFYDAFEAALAKDAPGLLAEMRAIQSAYADLLRSASIEVAKAGLAYTGSKGPIGDFVRSLQEEGVGSTFLRLADQAYTALVDDLHPLSVAERRLQQLYAQNQGQRLDLKRAASPYALARLSRDAYAAGHMDLMHGVTPYRAVDPEGPSLAKALEVAFASSNQRLSERSAAVREEPGFRQWFEGSQIQGGGGQPLVVYHGSNAERAQFATVNADGAHGVYFTATASHASAYARERTRERGGSPTLHSAYLSIKNPLVIDAPAGGLMDALRARFSATARKEQRRATNAARSKSAILSAERVAELQAQGFDGVVNRAADEIIAFRPDQIRVIGAEHPAASSRSDRSRSGKWDDNALAEFDAYLISRRMVHEWDRFNRGELERAPDRNTKAFHEQVIADLEEANPSWREASGQVYGWLNNLWKKEFEAGLITESAYKAGLDMHPDYVPLMRDVSDKGPGTSSGRRPGAMQFAGGVREFRGSTRDVISPLSSMMRRAYELNAIIKRNDTIKALDDLAEAAGPGAGAIVERLPPKESQAFEVDALEALKKAAKDAGLSERDVTTLVASADTLLEGSTKATLFRQVDVSPRKGEAIVFVWRGGKKQPLLLADGEFGQAMYQALTGMTRDLRNVVVDAMAGATQLLRYGVTLSPEFMSRNIVRDQIATWINSDVGFIPGYHTAKGLLSELRQDRDAIRYASAGGMRGGANVAATSRPFPTNDAEARAQLQRLRGKGWRVRRFASWRGLAELTDLSETSTRLGVFKTGFDQARRRGLNDYEAMVEAAYSSRDTLDFGRRGSRMLTAARVVTFLNAALQGLDKTVRVLTAGGNLRRVLAPFGEGAPRTDAERRALAHAYKAWAKVSALGALGLGLRMLYADDPEYQEINDRLRATHWVFKWDGTWVFVPKPFELATLSNVFERSYEAAALKDPTAMERLLSDFSHTIAPPYEVPSLAVPFQIARNRDYLGAPIVPDHLRGTVDPQYQFNAYTSDFGKLLGRYLGVSPAVVDHAVTGFGGSLGRYVLQGSNMAGEAITGRPSTAAGPEDIFLSRGFVRRVARGSVSQEEFWDQVSRDGGHMAQALGTFRQLSGQGQDAEAIAYLNNLDPQTRGYVRARAFTQDRSEILHPMVRAQEALSVIASLRTAARTGQLLQMDGTPVPMTPQDRRAVDNALADLALVEMRNALVATGVRGYDAREPLDRAAVIERLRRASPLVLAALDQNLTLQRIPPADLVERAWPEVRARWEAPMEPGVGTAALRLRRFRSGGPAERVAEIQRMLAERSGSPGQ